jgi:hypothetical protein
MLILMGCISSTSGKHQDFCGVDGVKILEIKDSRKGSLEQASAVSPRICVGIRFLKKQERDCHRQSSTAVRR